MKTEIQPRYHLAKVRCACGAEFEVGSTKPEIRLDICSLCHPFFTGKQKIMDVAGRIERFKKKYGDYKTKAPVVKKPKKRVKK